MFVDTIIIQKNRRLKMKNQMCFALLFSIFAVVSAGAGVYDLPTLSTSYPAYSSLYSDVQVSSATATGTAFAEADETLNCVYAYLHPQSPYRYQTSYKDRLRVLLEAHLELFRISSLKPKTMTKGAKVLLTMMSMRLITAVLFEPLKLWMSKPVVKAAIMSAGQPMVNGWSTL